MKYYLTMEIRAVFVESIQAEHSRQVIEKTRLIAKNWSWNQSMAVYDSDTEDF